MRTITKLMMTRTLFDPNAPRIQDIHATVQHILNLGFYIHRMEDE